MDFIMFLVTQSEKKKKNRGAGVAQLVKHLTLGFDSGHDLMVRGFKSRIDLCSGQLEACLGFYLSPSLCPSPTCSVSVSLKINK